MTTHNQQESDFDVVTFAQNIAFYLWELKVKNVLVIDVRGRVSYTDFIVIGSGTSPRHVKSAANELMTNVKNENGIIALGYEGLEVGEWGLIDLDYAIVHLFYGDVREEYDFETMWIDAPRLKLEDPPKELYGTFETDNFPEQE